MEQRNPYIRFTIFDTLIKNTRGALPPGSIMTKLTFFFLFVIVVMGCDQTKVIDDLGDQSFTFLNQDSVSVQFPEDFEGKYLVMGFIYTHCPDVCPLITRNMVEVQKQLDYPEDVQFLGITFDPQRDTPSVLKDYKEAFNLDRNFDFITTDSTSMSQFLDSVRVRTQVSLSTENDAGEKVYFLNHSDKIMVVDPKSRVVLEYGGSMTKPSYIVEDLQKIRN